MLGFATALTDADQGEGRRVDELEADVGAILAATEAAEANSQLPQPQGLSSEFKA